MKYHLAKSTRLNYGVPTIPDLVFDSLDEAIESAKAQTNPVGHDVYLTGSTYPEGAIPIWKYWENRE